MWFPCNGGSRRSNGLSTIKTVEQALAPLHYKDDRKKSPSRSFLLQNRLNRRDRCVARVERLWVFPPEVALQTLRADLIAQEVFWRDRTTWLHASLIPVVAKIYGIWWLYTLFVKIENSPYHCCSSLDNVLNRNLKETSGSGKSSDAQEKQCVHSMYTCMIVFIF